MAQASRGSSNIFSWHLVVVNRHNYLLQLIFYLAIPQYARLARLAWSASAYRSDLIKNVVLIKSNAVSQANCQPGGEGGVAPAVDRQTGSDKDTLQSKLKHLQGLLGLPGSGWGRWWWHYLMLIERKCGVLSHTINEVEGETAAAKYQKQKQHTKKKTKRTEIKSKKKRWNYKT